MVLVILSHLPYFSRKLYRDFVNRRFDDINFFLRKKDLGFGLVGQWVSLVLSQMWFVQALMIFVGLLLLQVRRRDFFLPSFKFGGFNHLF